MAILKSRRRLAGVALLCACVAAAVRPARAQAGLEYEVKAAFLYNFVKFIEWPPDAWRPGDPFRVCLLGDDPFAGGLERAVRGDDVDGSPIAVEKLPTDADPASCQMLFVPRAYASRSAAIARTLGNAPVLMVGESDGFLKAGGVINLLVDGGHVRFDISLAQASARGLRISSKLLRVARRTGTERDDR